MNSSTEQGSSSNSASASATSGSNASRKERGAIAAQACETCRSRKQKCDEQRPQCGTCAKFKLDCQYREPQPTKKDKTLVEILERLKAVEGKLDGIQLAATLGPTGFNPLPHLFSHAATAPSMLGPHGRGDASSVPKTTSTPASPTLGQQPSQQPAPSLYSYVAPTHKMLQWPVINDLLQSQKLPQSVIGPLQTEWQSVVVGIRGMTTPLPTTGLAPGSTTLPGSALPQPGGPPPWDTMQRLAKSYFDSFNLLYPIMDRQAFGPSTLALVFNDAAANRTAAILAYLVFALGEFAMAHGMSLAMDGYKAQQSIRTAANGSPPGLGFFNEARDLMGFSLSEVSVENVQMYALASLYLESCGQHIEFWRMAASASLACQALFISQPDHMLSPQTDKIKRIFWHCYMMETCLHLGLGLPLTGLEKFRDSMEAPDFGALNSEDDYISNQASHFQQHFASQIFLTKMLVSCHEKLTSATGSNQADDGPPPRTQLPFPVIPSELTGMIRAFELDLQKWRQILPPYLRWQEERPDAYPNVADSSTMFDQGIGYMDGAGPPPNLASAPMFTTNLSAPIETYPFAADIQVALLRTRYYHTKYLVTRPVLHKAIHHDDLSHDEALIAADCLRSSIRWPVAMAPTCYSKALIPYAFCWTLEMTGVLVLLHVTQQVPCTVKVRRSFCGDGFEADARESVALYVAWLRDMKGTDVVARWCWPIVKALYALDD